MSPGRRSSARPRPPVPPHDAPCRRGARGAAAGRGRRARRLSTAWLRAITAHDAAGHASAVSWPHLLLETRRLHGAASPAVAARCGVPLRTWHRRTAAERWRRPFPISAVHPTFPPGARTMTSAAYLWRSARGEAAVGLESALFLHGLGPPPNRIGMVVPRSRRGGASSGVLALARDLHEDEVTVREGLPTTTVARTLVDLAARWEVRRLVYAALAAKQAGQLQLGAIEAQLRRRPRVPGRAKLRQVAAALEGDGSDSGFEHEVVAAFAALGYAPTHQQLAVRVRGAVVRLDAAWRPALVGLECHGRIAHASREQFERDARRHNDIAELEQQWVIYRVTWWMWLNGFAPFARRVIGTIERRTRDLEGR